MASASAFVEEFLATLDLLREQSAKATEMVDHIGDVARSLSLEEHAQVALNLDETRDAVDEAKTRLTHAKQRCDEWFALSLATEKGEMRYEDEHAVFYAGYRGFFNAPSQNKAPEKFAAMLDWLHANGHADAVEVAASGKTTIEGLDKICQILLEEGKALPPFVNGHLIEYIRVKRKRPHG